MRNKALNLRSYVVLFLATFLIIQSGVAYSQQKYSTSTVDKHKFEHWQSPTHLSRFSGKTHGYKWDILSYRRPYDAWPVELSVIFGSIFMRNIFPWGNQPGDKIVYLASFGASKEIITNRLFTTGLVTNLYLFPIGLYDNWDSTSDLEGIDEIRHPRYADFALRIDSYGLGLAMGYRHQFGKWEFQQNVVESEFASISTAKNFTVSGFNGFYVEAYIGLSFFSSTKQKVQKRHKLPNPKLNVTLLGNEGEEIRLLSGEEQRFRISINNNGPGHAERVKCSYKIVGPGSSNVSLKYSSTVFQHVVSNQKVSALLPIEVAENIHRKYELDLEINCVEKDGFRASTTVPITIEPKNLHPPILSVERASLSTNTLNALETAYLRVDVKNSGDGDAYDTYVELMGAVNGLSFPHKTSFKPISRKGGIQSVFIPLEADMNLVTGETQLSCRIVEPGFDISIPTKPIQLRTQAFQAPQLQLSEFYGKEERSGNPNRQINVNETFELRLTVTNQGIGDADNVSISTLNSQTGVEFLGYVQESQLSKKEHVISRIGAGESVTLAARYFISSSFKDSELEFDVIARERFNKFGFSQNRTLRIDSQLPVISTTYEDFSDERSNLTIPVMQFSEDVLNVPKTNARRKNALAVIIGMPDAKFASEDAKLMEIYFKDVFGIDGKYNVIKLADQDIERSDLIRLFEQDLRRAVNNQTELYVFYSGHGITDEAGNTYILPTDGSPLPSLVPKLCYSFTELYSALNALQAAHTTVIIDACFSGTDKTNNFLLADIKGPSTPKPDNSYMAYDNFTIISASTKEQTSWAMQETGYGLFTYYFASALKGHADSNSSRQEISLREVKDYVTTNVEAQSQALYGRLQTPTFWTSDGDWNRIIVKH